MSKRVFGVLFLGFSCLFLQGTAFSTERTAIIKGSLVNVRAEASVKSRKVSTLFSNATVTVSDSFQGNDGDTWYPVKYTGGQGFVRSDFIKFPVQYQRDEAFENALNQQGFPESYKDGLRSLHAEFPSWRFEGFKTNLDWNRVLDGEMEGTGSLVDKNAISSWKSTDAGKYDWNSGTWPGFDGPTWVGASRSLTAYYMDPRNFLDESYIFQFLLHSYNPEEQTRDGLSMVLKGSFMEGKGTSDKVEGVQSSSGGTEQNAGGAVVAAPGTEEAGGSSSSSGNENGVVSAVGPGGNLSTSENEGSSSEDSGNGNRSGIDYVDILMKAAEQTRQNPYVLAAMILQEQGKGTSGSVSGASGFYNYFNVGAYAANGMGAVERGLWYAGQSGSYGRPWNSVEKSIIGGAVFFAENYLKAGQNTLYLKKWNVQGANLYKHQYMTNVQGAAEEGAKLSKAYTAEMKNKALVFSIPIYENMPQDKSPIPTGTGSPNNYLSSLSINGFNLDQAFLSAKQNYSVTLPSGTKSVEIRAEAVDSKAEISGAGTQNLDGRSSLTVSVKAENKQERVYTVNISYGEVKGSSSEQSASGRESGVEIIEVGKSPLS